MGIYTNHSSIYSNIPLSSNPGRDEYFLIDVLGTWIPECDLITYGLLGTGWADQLFKLRERTNFNPNSVYHDYGFFTSDDLVRYLSSTEDLELDSDVPDETVEEIMNFALDHYDYSQCSETMMRHAIMEIMYDDFVKSVTLVYPWQIRPIDTFYLRRITPPQIFEKLNLASGKLSEIAAMDSEIEYTTIISNSIEDISLMVDDPKKYHCQAAMFLLRNHSQNMEIVLGEDEYPSFNEVGMEELLPKLIDFNTGLPLTGMRFGRFEPRLFSETEKRIPGFNQY